jgi:uncharacterized protein (TIGR03067 family)
MTCKHLIAPALFTLLLSVAGCASKEGDDGTKVLQGTWVVMSKDGKQVLKQATFERDQFSMQAFGASIGATKAAVGREPGMIDRSTFRVDNAKSPAQIDFVILDGEHQGRTRVGIYAVQDNTLQLCVAELDAPRPTAFSTTPKTALLTLTRK